jgi:peptide/nickel transport system ATP-binding protein/oligopeptide transport system ATP-binding protein
MATETPCHTTATTLVHACQLTKSYRGRRSIFRDGAPIHALDNVELEIRAGSTLALVGESGSGKSTLARCLARLERPDSGEIWFDGRRISDLQGEPLFCLRREIQMIFQDPASALNPGFSCREIIEEPMAIQRIGTRSDRRQRALELMEQVGLPPSLSHKSPMDLSGGQRQRLAIARALALKPRFLILDEAFAGLDLSIKAQLANLLLDQQAAASLTYLYISHDLDLVAHFADEVAVMHQGKIIEKGPAAQMFRNPRHQITRTLVESIPCVM